MKRKAILILALALFSLFFGAGNLILPPQLGYRAGSLWWLVCLGFSISAVLIPMLGILAHARLQGSMFNFAEKVSPVFSLVYCYLVYLISITLPAPRTASVTHEMAIAPYLGSSSLLSSLGYFTLVFLIVLNRSRITSLIGKWLTPGILIVLVLLIGSLTLWTPGVPGPPLLEHAFSAGILEGYQTFDAIGAVVVGGVIIISLNIEKPELDSGQRFRAISTAGWLAGGALLLLYAGLILSGSLMGSTADAAASRTDLLGAMSDLALGSGGRLFLSLLIALACFTTAVGIVTGTADFVRSRFGNSRRAYRATALVGCLLGVLMGQLPVDSIIAVALPALMLIYPLTIALILLNAMPASYTPPFVFRMVVVVVLLFSLPDFFNSLGLGYGGSFLPTLPLQEYQMAWVLPSVAAYGIGIIGWRTGIWKSNKEAPGQ